MRKRSLAVLTVLAIVAASCTTLAPGADPVVVRAEQIRKLSFEVVDSFLLIEHENQAAIEAAAPGVHAFAEKLRRDFPKAHATLIAMTKAYKSNRTPEAKADLVTWISVVQAAMNEAQGYLAKWRT